MHSSGQGGQQRFGLEGSEGAKRLPQPAGGCFGCTSRAFALFVSGFRLRFLGVFPQPRAQQLPWGLQWKTGPLAPSPHWVLSETSSVSEQRASSRESGAALPGQSSASALRCDQQPLLQPICSSAGAPQSRPVVSPAVPLLGSPHAQLCKYFSVPTPQPPSAIPIPGTPEPPQLCPQSQPAAPSAALLLGLPRVSPKAPQFCSCPGLSLS